MLRNLKKALKKRLGIKSSPYLIENTDILTVGKMSFHNGGFVVQGSQHVQIGSYCALGENIRIITENHDYNYPVMQYTFYGHYFGKAHPGVNKYPPNKERTKGGVAIGSDVWIGHNTTILSGVKIGNGAILANGSIVTRDVEPYSIVSGIPARKIKMRFNEDVVEFMQKTEWWNWSESKILKNEKFCSQNLNELTVQEIESIIQ